MLAAYALVCSQCGNLRSVCSDPERDWHVNESVCWPTATQQWGIRRLQTKFAKWKPEANPNQIGPLEGKSIWVSDIDFESADEDVIEVGPVALEVDDAPDV